MGNLCSKDRTKKKKEGEEGDGSGAGRNGSPRSGNGDETSSATVTTNIDDGTDEYLNEATGPRTRSAREDTEAFGGAGNAPQSASDHFDSEWDEGASGPASRPHTGREQNHTVGSRDDLFSTEQDSALNMRLGTDKYKGLEVTPSESGDGGYGRHPWDDAELHSMAPSSARRSEREGTPEHPRSSSGENGYVYNPMHFHDEDTSLVERDSDAFDTPREHFTESQFSVTPSAARLQVPERRGSDRPAEPSAALPTPIAPRAHPNEPFEHLASPTSALSFTVTTVRNNAKSAVSPAALSVAQQGSNWGFAPLALTESSEPFTPGNHVFHSCRSDATLATTANTSYRNSPRGVSVSHPPPLNQRAWMATSASTTSPSPQRTPAVARRTGSSIAATPSEAMLYSCRSFDSLSSQSLAALRLPARTRSTTTAAEEEEEAALQPLILPAKKAVEAKHARAEKQPPRRPVKPPVAETPLDTKAKVLKAQPTTMPLPKPRRDVPSSLSSTLIASPSDSHKTEQRAAAGHQQRNATRASAVRPQGGRIVRAAVLMPMPMPTPSEARSLAPPPSSAFRSFPPTPSAMGDSVSSGVVGPRSRLAAATSAAPRDSESDRGRSRHSRTHGSSSSSSVPPVRQTAAPAEAAVSSQRAVPSPSPAGHWPPSTQSEPAPTVTTARNDLESVAFHSMVSPTDTHTTATSRTAEEGSQRPDALPSSPEAPAAPTAAALDRDADKDSASDEAAVHSNDSSCGCDLLVQEMHPAEEDGGVDKRPTQIFSEAATAAGMGEAREETLLTPSPPPAASADAARSPTKKAAVKRSPTVGKISRGTVGSNSGSSPNVSAHPTGRAPAAQPRRRPARGNGVNGGQRQSSSQAGHAASSRPSSPPTTTTPARRRRASGGHQPLPRRAHAKAPTKPSTASTSAAPAPAKPASHAATQVPRSADEAHGQQQAANVAGESPLKESRSPQRPVMAGTEAEARFLQMVQDVDQADGGQALYEGLASSSSSSAARDESADAR